MARSEAGDPDNEDLGPEWRETEGLHRTAKQFDYDTFWGLMTAGIRASAAETTSASVLKSIPEVIVTVGADDLDDAEAGTALVGAVRVSVPTVERIACGADTRLRIAGDDGEDLHLGRKTRYFTSAQRRALIARYTGCAWPGCTAPAVWCDTHHIAWFKRDTGPTDTGNGILLCSFHHHVIHATDTRWRIVVHQKQPYLVPRSWQGDPEPRHRMGVPPTSPDAPHRPDDIWRPLRT